MKPTSLFRFAFLLLGSVVMARAETSRVEFAGAAQPQLAVAQNGEVWLAYGQEHNIFVACSRDEGKSFGEPAKVATLPKLMLGMRRGPRIAVHGDNITVTAIADELVAFHSSDRGSTWNGPVRINAVAESAQEGLHDLAAALDGELFVTWLDQRSGSMEVWGASSKDGGATWGQNERVYQSPEKSVCECCHPNALFDASGNLAVMWRNSIEGSRDLWMATRTAGTRQFGSAQKLGSGTWRLNACPMDGGRIVALESGKFGAVWQRASEVFFSSPEVAEKLLGPGKQPVALQSGSHLVVFWQQGTDLVTLHAETSVPKKYASNARFAAVAALPGTRGTVVAYEQGAAKGKAPGFVVERL